SASGGSDVNYNFSYNAGALTVNKATLTCIADDKQRKEGEANPEFTMQINGYVNGDTEPDIDQLPAATCPAEPESPPGTYDIVPEGGADINYDFEYENGTLTVQTATSVESVAKNPVRLYPNPTSDRLFLKGQLSDKNYRIYDSQGTLVLSGKLNGSEIQTNRLAPGSYYLTIDKKRYKFIKK
ncbi:MAG: T9SS type A sorting domain-containing protein, partial [Marinilabiliaceae bacterium]|nr:T9SS type A sorting domain-containing protein [Marinilabiliaceae bacterium]